MSAIKDVTGLEIIDSAEILPETERNGREVEPASATAPVGHHSIVATGTGTIWLHDHLLPPAGSCA